MDKSCRCSGCVHERKKIKEDLEIAEIKGKLKLLNILDKTKINISEINKKEKKGDFRFFVNEKTKTEGFVFVKKNGEIIK